MVPGNEYLVFYGTNSLFMPQGYFRQLSVSSFRNQIYAWSHRLCPILYNCRQNRCNGNYFLKVMDETIIKKSMLHFMMLCSNCYDVITKSFGIYILNSDKNKDKDMHKNG